MEGLGGLHRAGVVVVVSVLLVVLATLSSPAAARPTVGFGDAVHPARAAPCYMAATTGNMGRGNARASEDKVEVTTKNYAPLLLNLLPRGSLPPSGPSRGINDIKP